MAFILSFGEDGPDTDVIATGSRYFVRMSVGFDPDDEISYFATVCLDFSASIDGYELSFWLSAEHKNGFEDILWDGEETWFIKRLERGLIRQAILFAVRLLARKIGPYRVFMLAMRPSLPDRALQKYFEINRVFEQLGYTVTECDPTYGNKCWLIERPSVE